MNSLALETYSLESKVILGMCFAILVFTIVYLLLKILEMAFVLKNKKPFYVHFYLKLKKLSTSEKAVLIHKFPFYNKLSEKHKTYFEHRVVFFIKEKEFIGRDNFQITDEVRVLVSATAIMLTFGFRNFDIGLVSKIVIYPSGFYSNTNKAHHKGEFNPKLKALVLSWEDFEEGNRIDNDNLNLGIHELTHAIHFSSLKKRDVSSIIFKDSYNELKTLLSTKKELRELLLKSKYFRGYAFTNKYEFLAVIIENFIETPVQFKTEFPEIYAKVKQMFNFSTAI